MQLLNKIYYKTMRNLIGAETALQGDEGQAGKCHSRRHPGLRAPVSPSIVFEE